MKLSANITSFKKNIFYYFFGLSIIIFIICQVQKFNYSPVNDTYIYLQYARNLASGNGLSFNAGEPSYGITSPLWAVFLVVPYLINFNPFWFAKVSDLIFALLSIGLFWKLTMLVNSIRNNDLTNILNPVFTGIFTLNVWFIRWSFTGMETSLAIFCVLAIFYLYLKKHYIRAFTLLAIFYLIRPESIMLFFVLLFFLFSYKDNMRKILFSALIYIGLLIIFLGFAKYYFGTFVPNTAIGKTSFNFGFCVYFTQFKKIIVTISVSGLIELVCSVILILYYSVRKNFNKIDLIFVSWVAGLFILYLLTDSDIISRYLLIITPFITLFSMQLFSYLKKCLQYIWIPVFLILFQSQALFYYYIKPHTDNFTYGRNSCFESIGYWLSDNSKPGSKIIIGDVGTMGYYSNRYIIDAGALVNRNLNLNKQIMNTPISQRNMMSSLLDYIDADYLVQRDSIEDPYNLNYQNGGHSLQFLFSKEFPGLGISDPAPKYYSVYKILK